MSAYDAIKGDFTILKYIMNLDRKALEEKVGFGLGRLDRGAVIVTLAPDVKLAVDDIEFGASNRWSRSSAAAPWAPQYVVNPDGTMASNAIEANLKERVLSNGKTVDVEELKLRVIKFFELGGDKVPAKVLPTSEHTSKDYYPDVMNGAIPQFKMKNPKKFILYKKIPGLQASAR